MITDDENEEFLHLPPGLLSSALAFEVSPFSWAATSPFLAADSFSDDTNAGLITQSIINFKDGTFLNCA